MRQTPLKDRLKEAIREKGTNASELAKLAEVKPSFIYDILNGKSTNPNTAKMAKISSILETDLSTLLGIDPIPTSPQQNASDYVMISSILTASSADGGKIELEEREGDPYYFRESWIRERLGTDPENLRMVFVEGDSMEPTLCQGDMVLVDIARKNPSPPGIFVLFDGMGLVAKRLEFLAHSKPPAIQILSDNPQYHSYERKVEETDIVGRVVWFAREI